MRTETKSGRVVTKMRTAALRRAAGNQAPAPPVPAKPAERAEIKPAPLNARSTYEQKNVLWRLDPKPGTPREYLTEPEYYAVIAEQMRPGDLMLVHGEDARGPYYAEILIRQAGRGFRPVALLLRIVDLPALRHEELADFPTGYEPRFDTGTNSWYVWRQRDNWRMTPEPGVSTLEQLRREFADSAIFRQ